MIVKLTVGKGNYKNIFHTAGRGEITNFVNIPVGRTTVGHNIQGPGLKGQIPTSNMASKQRHRKAKMATSDTNMG